MCRSIIALMAGVTLTWLACGPKPATNEPARTTEPTGDPRSAERPADTRSRPESGSTVEITAAEAKAKKLPPVGFSINTSGTAWTVSKLPRKNVYLELSGPPGGPLSFSVRTLFLNPKANIPVLRYFVQDSFRKAHHQPLTIAKTTRLFVGGNSRDAIAFTAGKSLARTAWCAVHMHSAKQSVREFVLLFGYGASKGQPTCAEIAKHSAIAPVLHSFRLLP